MRQMTESLTAVYGALARLRVTPRRWLTPAEKVETPPSEKDESDSLLALYRRRAQCQEQGRFQIASDCSGKKTWSASVDRMRLRRGLRSTSE